MLGILGWEFGPHLAGQIRNLNAAAPEILQTISSGRTAADPGAGHGLSGGQQRIRDWLAGNHELIARAFERGAGAAANVAANAVWLFAVPILAIFILRDGRPMAAALIDAAGRRRDQTVVKRILGQVDSMLGNYIRAQLALAGLSCLVYSVSMLLL